MHEPALLNEAISLLDPKSGSIYIDCTLGSGGHTAAILDRGASVHAIDRDPESPAISQLNHKNLVISQGDFRELDKLVSEKVDGVLFDLGISSDQLDSPDRGFSYRFEGPLDLRMDREQGTPCYELLKQLELNELIHILKDYGEERYSRRIARQMMKQIPETTQDLREIVARVTPWKGRSRVLARVWQGLRIFVNDELACLSDGLRAATRILKPGGRTCVISYHSLEDRIVKRYFRDEPSLSVLTKKPIRPSENEVEKNRRARSAKLRCAEKI
jgi:16S rRNA (cytosine1402-N4)-methyltransferase